MDKATEVLALSLEKVGKVEPFRINNSDPSHQLDKVILSVKSDSINLELEAKGGCNPDRVESNISIKGWYISSVLLGLGSYNDSYWSQKVYQGEDISKTSFEGKTQLKVAGSLLDGTPHQLKLLERFKDLLLQKAKSEKARLNYLQKDQVFQYQLPFRLEVICTEFDQNKTTKRIKTLSRSSKVLIKELSVPVRYQADPNLKIRKTKPLALQGSETGAIFPKSSFLKLEKVEILSGPRNLRGACPMSADFKLQIIGEGSGYIQLTARRNRTVLYKGKVMKMGAEPVEVNLSLPVKRPLDANDYEQFLQKVEFEVLAKPESQKNSQLFPLRKRLDPYLWQASCIEVIKVAPQSSK
ncbi:hypothetical protein [Sneathiella limimaris]|uniref:hypothetical protein n=1 Tax=Sneathiella limimaris TaxID=1964213 RepID=UPI00146A2290|nr:hypothetical protein [Sneathiella limimaris]